MATDKKYLIFMIYRFQLYIFSVKTVIRRLQNRIAVSSFNMQRYLYGK